MDTPADLYYTDNHEWISAEGDVVTVGITDYAQSALGDVVYVELPTMNSSVTVGVAMCEVESTKSVAEIVAPVTGTVVQRNSRLLDEPSLLNSDPYGDGWICRLQFSPPLPDGLLDAATYQSLTQEEK